MERNVGKLDQGMRIAAGIVLLAVLGLVEGPWRWIGLLGIVLLVTAFARTCPAYTLLGVSTADKRSVGRGR